MTDPSPVVPPALDRRRRPLRSLRISVTDRCNLRCAYCMPEEEYVWLPRRHLLSFEEIDRLVDRFMALGVDKLRITGGEPLLRQGLPELITRLSRKEGLRELALTTNGVRLTEQAEALKSAGLTRITVSLDTLDPARFRALTRRDALGDTLAGIEAAADAGFEGTKLDTVAMRSRNGDELVQLLEFARKAGVELRFIEYMDVGGATQWNPDEVISRDEILGILTKSFGPIESIPRKDSAPANRYRLGDGTTFGIIASTTAPFCSSCDRARLTSDGTWFTCLYAPTGTDLRGPLRQGASDPELEQRILGIWREREDRGAERRLEERSRGALLGTDALRADPRLEMHTRGG